MEHGDGAGGENRTPDPLITNQLLYQLSYAGIWLVYPAKQHRAAIFYGWATDGSATAGTATGVDRQGVSPIGADGVAVASMAVTHGALSFFMGGAIVKVGKDVTAGTSRGPDDSSTRCV